MKIAIINCVNQKQQIAMAAGDLYTSISFKAKKAFVEKVYDKWYIFSLKYGIISPDTIIEPYNTTLVKNNRNHQQEFHNPNMVNTDTLSKLVCNQLQFINGELHYHTPKDYYNMVTDGLYVKQQGNQSLTVKQYKEALNLWNGNNLDECLQTISKKYTPNPEQLQYWVHPEQDEFYGTSYQLVKQYTHLGLNDADARKVARGKNKTHKGWKLKSGL
jgi:hypothetical protein